GSKRRRLTIVRLGLIHGELFSMSSDICKQAKAVRLEPPLATRSRLSQSTHGQLPCLVHAAVEQAGPAKLLQAQRCVGPAMPNRLQHSERLTQQGKALRKPSRPRVRVPEVPRYGKPEDIELMACRQRAHTLEDLDSAG